MADERGAVQPGWVAATNDIRAGSCRPGAGWPRGPRTGARAEVCCSFRRGARVAALASRLQGIDGLRSNQATRTLTTCRSVMRQIGG
jgi:hypothetical protein